MRSVMGKMFIPPTFSDPEQTRSARWLNTFLIFAFSLLTLYFLVVPAVSWAGIKVATLSPTILSLFAAILGTIWLLMHHGRLQMAILLTLTTLFLVPTYLNFFVYQSIRSPDIWVYFILIPLTGLLLGRRAMRYFALLCLSCSMVLFWLESVQMLSPNVTPKPQLIDALLLGISILLSTLLLQATINKAEAKATEAEHSLQALRRSNQQLELSRTELQQARDELEARVDIRTQELRTSNQRLQDEINERQRLMDALRYSEANWRSLVQNAPELIVTLTSDGMINFANRAINGHLPEQLIQQPVTAIHNDEHHQQILAQAVEEVLTTGQTVSYQSEERLGEEHYWRVNRLGPICEAGEITSLILISTDISEQKQTEMAMLHAQKVESLGLMAGGVAHDFNNLLTAMIGQASLAMEKLPTEQDAVRNHIQNILFASQRATELTRQMLNYVGQTTFKFTQLDLNHLIEENIQFFSASIPKHIKLQSDLLPNLPPTTGDLGQIQQLLMNLILNAADAIADAAGTISVSTTLSPLTADEISTGEFAHWKWSGAALRPGDYIRLQVADTGCGMDKATLSKIFDPFFTTKFTGRGLGLASVIGIVRSHGGDIHVMSEPGRGTTFQVLFPVTEQINELEQENDMTQDFITLEGKFVLLIDDEDDVRQVTAEILETEGVQAIGAASGTAGIRTFEQHLEAIDLVLLDLSMPDLNGEEVARRLWAMQPELHIIFLSGYDEHEVIRYLKQTTQVAFLQKPFELEELLRAVRQQLLKRARSKVAAAPSEHSQAEGSQSDLPQSTLSMA